MKEVPVFLFLGFLGSGKSTFIQETMEDPRFDEEHERTLLLVLEEGEVEYDASRFAVKTFAVETVGGEDLTQKTLADLRKKHRPQRVVLECNGMMTLDKLFEVMPENWVIAQQMAFFEASTFLLYNQNMRQLVFDKLKDSDMVVFNRFRETDRQEEFHKIVRGASRRPQIVYEYVGGRAVYDEIEDPLPFDLTAPIVEIADNDYAFFYRDLVEDLRKYDGLTVRFKARLVSDRSMPPQTAVCGRHVMTCCAADISFHGLVLLTDGRPFEKGEWYLVTASVKVEWHKIYGQVGPVLFALAMEKAAPPEKEVADFF